MKNNKKGFIAISIIYSFFILFITIMLLIMYSYVNDRKSNIKIKSELIESHRSKAPDVVFSSTGSTLPNPTYEVTISVLDGGNGIAFAKYAWSDSPTITPNIDLTSYNQTVTAPTNPGRYYLIVKACDINLSCKTVITNFFNVGDPYFCVRAGALHNATCTNEDENGYCLADGMLSGSTKSFGNLASSVYINLGDAFDCDINGDGEYNPDNERFYYVSDAYNATNKSYNVNRAVLVYSSNVHNGTQNNTSTTAYTTASTPVPTTASSELPSTSTWSNLEFNSFERTIVADGGYGTVPTSYFYSGEEEVFTAPETGKYKIELWGAQGGRSMSGGAYSDSTSKPGGKGGYTTGIIQLNKDDVLYINVGGKGQNGQNGADAAGGYNGGGLGTHDHEDNEAAGGGGGATDIRLVSKSTDESESLASRIMVAGGGGGAAYNQAGGYAGGLIGEKAYYGASATQSTGYAFGIGQDGAIVISNVEVAGGGAGWYGGYAVSDDQTGRYRSAGGGGTSYISGFGGCVAIESASNTSIKSGCNDPTIETLCSYHYSGKYFTDSDMKAGNQEMPSHDGKTTITGNEGDGYAKITLLKTTATYNYDSNVFTYTNKAARLLNYEELINCIGYRTISYDSNDNKVINDKIEDKCNFLFENTKFFTENNAEGYFLETPYANSDYIWTIDSSTKSIHNLVSKSASNKYGVRPVIEVDKAKMQV